MRYIDGVTDGSSADLMIWLEPQLADAQTLAIRTGFFTVPGAEFLRRPLKELLERGGTFHAVLGGQPEQTDPGALRILADAIEGFPHAASIHLAAPAGGIQNAKTYYVKNTSGRAAAYVGSANLTRGGLTANQEAGVLLDSQEDGDEALEAVLDGVRAWAEHPHTVKITLDAVDVFTRWGKLTRAGRAHRTGPADASLPLCDVMPTMLDRLEAMGSAQHGNLLGIPTGFIELDALLGGWQPGSLNVVGARPAMGKSMLLLDFARSAAIKHSLPTVLFTLEMPVEEVDMRIVSAEARVALHAMRSGTMNEDDWDRTARRMSQIADSPFWINDTGSLTTIALCEEAVNLVRDRDIRLIVVDYLQLVSPNLRAESREREVSEVARDLKSLALDLKIPIIVAAQLNRSPEQRDDKRPVLADLRESDAIAQAADVVILLHRDDAYDKESPRAGEADLIVAKHRNGPTATLTVAFQGHYSRFVDMATG